MINRFLTLILGIALLGGMAMSAKAENSSLDFFLSLDYSDGIGVIEAVCARFPVQYGTTLGLNGNPQIRPIEFKFSEDGVLYFDTVTYYDTYAELQAYPYLQVCVCDPETMTYIRFGGTVNFTDDPEIIDRCFASSEVLTGQFGDNREAVSAYYLTHAWLQVRSFTPGIPAKGYVLTNKYD